MSQKPQVTVRKSGPLDPDFLPTGQYPCLTLQLNITAHQSQESGKMVLTVREPNEHERYFSAQIALTDWSTIAREAPALMDQAMREMARLLGFVR